MRIWLNVAMIAVVMVGLLQTIRVAVNDLQNSERKLQEKIAALTTEAASAEPARKRDLELEIQSLMSQKVALANIRWGSVLWALPFSMFGILPLGIYWLCTLRALDIHVPAAVAGRAYYVGNLGKYVPGKAMVLILRSTALRPFGATIPLTMISVFVETLTTIAIGAAVGAFALSWIPVPRWLHYLAWVSAVCAVLPTLPPIFVPLLQGRLAQDSSLRQLLATDYNWKLMFRGWTLSLLGWMFLGTGLFFIVISMPKANLPPPSAVPPQTPMTLPIQSPTGPESQSSGYVWIVCVAACALSVVAGFVSMLPGGAGVRELVLTILLSPVVGFAAALIVAIVHRLVTIIGELLIAGLSILVARKHYRPRSDSTAAFPS